MKIIPIKIERSDKIYPKVVEWQLGNTCNYDCSFCSKIIKDGSFPWIDIKTAINVSNNLMDKSEGKKIKFQITGGEPTLYKDLPILLKHIYGRDHITTLFSNGSRTIRYWKDLANLNCLDILVLSFHLHQGADICHFEEIFKVFSKTTTIIAVYVTCTIEHFDQCVEMIGVLKKHPIIISMRGINKHEGILIDYSAEQLKILNDHAMIFGNGYNNKNHKITGTNWLDITYSDGTISKKRSSEIQVNSNLNSFIGWNCTIGQDFLDIKIDKVYRGMCEVGGKIANIQDFFTWQTDTVKCTKNSCGCAIDILQPKYKD